MAQLWRVTCIWIFCVSCLFERIQLPTVTAAVVPFDYFEDHEQLSYDLDTEQSKAKYDTRLLSEQLLKEQKSAESSHARPHGGGGGSGSGTDGDDANDVDADGDDDLQPHERAASCYNNGRKYTHGQKVPRQDACEVCLCMDGEIFCWWELCADKKPSNQLTSPHHSDSHLTASTANFDGRISTMQPTSSTQQQFSSNTAVFQHSKKPSNQKHTTKSLKMKSYLQQQQQKFEQQQKHSHKHTHTHASLPPSAGSSKILNFPENLPSVLYHDYRTEEHRHHQHQHHQQHLKHQQQQRLLHQKEQQLLLQQQQKQQQQQQQQHMQHAPATSAPPASGDNENVSDETETDSDILPEPPTKKPKVTATTTTTTPPPTTTTTTTTNNAKAAGVQATATTLTTTTTTAATSLSSLQGALTIRDGRADVQSATQSASDSGSGGSGGSRKSSSESPAELASAASRLTLPQQSAAASSNSLAIVSQPVGERPTHNRSNSSSSSEESQDDAFHRWLTSTETNNNKSNSNNAADDATFDATRSADLYGSVESQNLNKTTTTTTTTTVTNGSFPHVGGHAPQVDTGGGVYFRSSYNDYSSEFNGSVVNIDILLTTADDRQQQQQQQQPTAQRQQQQRKRVPSSSSSPGGDLIANHSSTWTADNNAAAATLDTVAAAGAAANISSSTPVQVTSTPSSSRQCNVMGTLYKIGDVLPQDTGNCLQCVCIDGSTSDDTPRVTCSPHNCPPLVLPDLFDATGY